MMEGPDSRKSRIQITLVREPGIKEKLERLSKEREDGSAVSFFFKQKSFIF